MKASGIVIILLVMAVTYSGSTLAGNFTVDNSKSTVKWHAKKVTGEHFGTILVKNGTLEVKNNALTGGTIEIDMKTIADDDIKDAGMKAKLVGHLKSDDFFSVEKFPVSTFNLTKIKKLKGSEYEFTGDLTIKGITHPVTFKAVSTVEGKILKADGQMVINRAKFDVRYGSGAFFSNLGDKMIYDEFTLDFQLVANGN